MVHCLSHFQKYLFLVFAIATIASAPQALSSDSDLAEFLIQEAKDLQLSKHPTWLKLLHFKVKSRKSEVLSKEFFLSKEGSQDPDSELEATIRAYFLINNPDPDSANNNHPRCRFPARYYWLSQHLSLPEYSLEAFNCQSFEKWALLENVESVSLYLVSGYFGNPASTFGHSLLKLNTTTSDEELNLLDLTLNYGALVPENESTFFYILRGLTGGYQAGFSDQYLYTQDQVYTRTEFRDIWDYKLELSDYQRTLLILHLWEIIGKKFTYYFLKENCAYRLAELMELTLEEDFLNNARAWYIPVEIFHRLNDIDKKRRANGESGVIHSINPLPSSRRSLYHQINQLPEAEAEAADAIIQAGPNANYLSLEQFTVEERIEILDTVISYHQYRQVQEEPTPSADRLKAKDDALLARLRLPVRKSSKQTVPTPISPAFGNRPLMLGAGIARDSYNDSFIRLRWAGFSKESITPNPLEGGELVVLDTAIGIKDSGAFLDQLDFIRVAKINTSPIKIKGENSLSWQLRLGMKREEQNKSTADDWSFEFGVGRAWKIRDKVTLMAMTDVSAHTNGPNYRIYPHLSLNTQTRNLGVALFAGIENSTEHFDVKTVWGGRAQYHFSPNKALRLEFSNETATQSSLSAIWYW